jgi:hypothetical protein
MVSVFFPGLVLGNALITACDMRSYHMFLSPPPKKLKAAL